MSAVYHGQTGLPTLKELSRSYRTIHKDLTRTTNRLQTRTRVGASAAPARSSMHRTSVRKWPRRKNARSGSGRTSRLTQLYVK
ncbi:MAG: hypothetical protein KGM92_02285 [Acidobacteriota bacterium]|nr:hypothetical protein [Acidobacteriota bacterium]